MSQLIPHMAARHNAVHLCFLWFSSTLPWDAAAAVRCDPPSSCPLAVCRNPTTPPKSLPEGPMHPPSAVWESCNAAGRLSAFIQVSWEQSGHDNASRTLVLHGNTSRTLPWKCSSSKVDHINWEVLDAGHLCYFSWEVLSHFFRHFRICFLWNFLKNVIILQAHLIVPSANLWIFFHGVLVNVCCKALKNKDIFSLNLF